MTHGDDNSEALAFGLPAPFLPGTLETVPWEHHAWRYSNYPGVPVLVQPDLAPPVPLELHGHHPVRGGLCAETSGSSFPVQPWFGRSVTKQISKRFGVAIQPLKGGKDA